MRPTKKERQATIRQMADYMLANAENCTRDTLLLQFSQSEVDSFHEEARQLANTEAEQKAAA